MKLFRTHIHTYAHALASTKPWFQFVDFKPSARCSIRVLLFLFYTYIQYTIQFNTIHVLLVFLLLLLPFKNVKRKRMLIFVWLWVFCPCLQMIFSVIFTAQKILRYENSLELIFIFKPMQMHENADLKHSFFDQNQFLISFFLFFFLSCFVTTNQ